ncbi:hypothetical protein TYRP_023124 [Tyrophagus putrescentiae]|nr:hypothetical protein TYRP_023124 [Tyrophagus putrescentiae]
MTGKNDLSDEGLRSKEKSPADETEENVISAGNVKRKLKNCQQRGLSPVGVKVEKNGNGRPVAEDAYNLRSKSKILGNEHYLKGPPAEVPPKTRHQRQWPSGQKTASGALLVVLQTLHRQLPPEAPGSVARVQAPGPVLQCEEDVNEEVHHQQRPVIDHQAVGTAETEQHFMAAKVEGGAVISDFGPVTTKISSKVRRRPGPALWQPISSPMERSHRCPVR